MAHDHAAHAGHVHGHTHAHHGRYDRAFAAGIALNLGFVVVEVVYGVLSHSMALAADAGHNLSDVLGLVLAWGATALARRRPTKRRTYGLRGTTIMASLVNGLVLLVVTGGIAAEALRRFWDPAPVAGTTVIVVASIGVLVNGVSAALFLSGRKDDLNVRGAFLHLAADAAVSLGVALGGVLLLVTSQRWLDPLMSLVICVVILASTWGLLRSSFNLALAAVPEGIDPDEVRAYLTGLPGVLAVHDLHIWAMSTTETALTAHLVMKAPCSASFLVDAEGVLHERFHIGHSTLQLEPPEPPAPCRLASDETV